MNAFPLMLDGLDRWVALALAAIALVAMARLAWRQARAPRERRSHPARLAALLIAQPIAAALLYFALFPPQQPGGADTLVVATAAATQSAVSAVPGTLRIALPEAPALQGLVRAPDLASVLRRHPEVRRIHVTGAGLEERDRDAAATREVAFDPAPLPRGLVELNAPDQAVAGALFEVTGRVHDAAGGFVELRDPAGRRIDRAAIPATGRFAMTALASAPGRATFRLDLRDRRRQLIESAEVPLDIRAVQAPRLLVLAGAPGPEVKFLRRWAVDAGLPLHTQIDAGGGMQLGDAPIRLDGASLSRFDAVVMDERAWAAMGDRPRAELLAAVRNGLGVILRVTAALSDAERRRLGALGFAVDAGRESESVRLMPPSRDEAAVRARLGPGTRESMRSSEAPLPEVPLLTRRALRIDARDGVALHSTTAGVTAGTWRAYGKGRIAVWSLTDTYALVMAGRDDLHNVLWSEGLAAVSRPRANPVGALSISGDRRVGQRMALCGISGQASVMATDGHRTSLLTDPRTGSRACAAFWPTSAGWHVLRSGNSELTFYVRTATELSGLRASQLHTETAMLRLASFDAPGQRVLSTQGPHGPRWPWWSAFLMVALLTWVLERSRMGRRG